MEDGQIDTPAVPTEPRPIWPPLPKRSTEAEILATSAPTVAQNGVSVVLPKAPETVQEIGLSPSFLLEHVIKVIHYAETPTAEHVARVVASLLATSWSCWTP